MSAIIPLMWSLMFGGLAFVSIHGGRIPGLPHQVPIRRDELPILFWLMTGGAILVAAGGLVIGLSNLISAA
jgi:hypothetical protein